VVHKIDNTYRTINDRKVSLQVCLWVVMEQCTCQLTSELFSAASIGGVADMGVWSHPILKSESKLMEPFSVRGNHQVYASYAVLGMVTKMKTNKLALIIDCGVDDF
jgi:hypothetical protein